MFRSKNNLVAPTLHQILIYGLPTLAAVVFSLNLLSFLHSKEAVLGLGLLLWASLAGRGDDSANETPGGPSLRGITWPLWAFVLYQTLVHGWLLPAADPVAWSEALLRAILILAVFHVCVTPRHASCRDAVSPDTTAPDAYGRLLCRALLLSALAIALLGLGQYYQLLPFLFPVFPGYVQTVYSVFGNQDLFGAYLALGLVLLAEYCLWRSPSPRRNRYAPYLAGCAALLLLWALLLSQSRSAWLAAGIGLAAVLLRHRESIPWHRLRRPQTLYWVTPFLLVLLINLGTIVTRITQTFSMQDTGGRLRLWFWEGALRMFGDNPIFGVGLGNFAYWSPQYLAEALHGPWLVEAHMHNQIHTLHAHSDFLELLAEGGLLMALLMIWLGAALYKQRLLLQPLTLCFISLALLNPLLRSAPHGFFLALYWIAMAKPPLSPPAQAKAGQATRLRWNERLAPALRVSAIALWLGTHTVVVLAPSYLQTQAEDAHLAMHHAATPEAAATQAAQARTAYGRAIAWPLSTAQVWENYGKLELERGNYAKAWERFKIAECRLDSGSLHWHAGQAAQHLGLLDEARAHYMACLYRWPDYEPARRALYALTPTPARAETQPP